RSPSRLPGPPSSGFGPAIDHRVAEPISLCSVDTPTTYSEGPVLLVVIGKTRGGEGAAERRFEPRLYLYYERTGVDGRGTLRKLFISILEDNGHLLGVGP
ncbi:hypothetical protein M514_28319, partial [Trichuris suis]